MPPKGHQSLGEELITVATRLPTSMVQAVDAHIETLRRVASWARINRSDAIRDLVTRGLQQAHRGEGGMPADGAPSTGPALLGLEQAAPAPTLPRSPHQEDEAREARSITPLQQATLAVPSPQAVEAAATVPVPELENSIDLGNAGFDPAKFMLGKLCRGRHEYGQTGQTLLQLPSRVCAQCMNEQRKQKRALQREGKT